MPSKLAYLVHPAESKYPGISAMVTAIKEYIGCEEKWSDWAIHAIECDNQNAFAVQPLFVRVLNKPGPIVIWGAVQRRSLTDLQHRLQDRNVFQVVQSVDCDTLYEQLVVAKSRHENNEPFLPRKYVVAILIVKKLRKGNYWAGNAKGYLWHDDVPKGRGVDERYAAITPVVLNDLLQHEVVIYKTSQGSKKFALNPKRKPEIHAIADSRKFWNEKLETILRKDTEEVSSHELLEPQTACSFSVKGDVLDCFDCSNATQMLGFVIRSPDCKEYEVVVTYEEGRKLRESLANKRIMVQFLEAFIS